MAMQNDAGETALYVAADNNFQEVFSYLLKFCDVDIVKIKSKSDMDAFHVAAKNGHLGMFDFDLSFVGFAWFDLIISLWGVLIGLVYLLVIVVLEKETDLVAKLSKQRLRFKLV